MKQDRPAVHLWDRIFDHAQYQIMFPHGGNANAAYTPNDSHRAAVQLGIGWKAKAIQAKQAPAPIGTFCAYGHLRAPRGAYKCNDRHI